MACPGISMVLELTGNIPAKLENNSYLISIQQPGGGGGGGGHAGMVQ